MYHSRIVLSVGGSVWYMTRNIRCSHNWLSFGKFQETERFLIHYERHFSSRLFPSGGTWKYAKAPSTKKIKLGEILYLLICSFLPCLYWLLRSRVRKSRRDLRITCTSHILHSAIRRSCRRCQATLPRTVIADVLFSSCPRSSDNLELHISCSVPFIMSLSTEAVKGYSGGWVLSVL